MSLPSSVIVNVVFLAFYALLLGPTIINVAKHRLGRQGGFVYVLIFCLGELPIFIPGLERADFSP
jgi:hypothetical protein